jgi:prepilin-type N-terminal cleavage/methylation domain-containing protein
MQFRRTDSSTACVKRACRGFTLAEVLAALAFMAIVIPVAVQGLKIASQTGVVAQRKSEATRVAERLLNEAIVSTNWLTSSLSGKVEEGVLQYRWQVRNDPWLQEPVRLVSVQVQFSVQGQDYDVRLSTLADSSR